MADVRTSRPSKDYQASRSVIQRLQSTPLNSMRPGLVGGDDQRWEGPFFTAYGAGPFHTAAEMEDWFNHKIDVCIQVGDMPSTTPRFRFDTLVLTHQDVAPRNIIVEEGSGRLILIDWGSGGIYPAGFEQAALLRQGPGAWDVEFCKAVMAEMPDGQDMVPKLLSGITFALTTGVLL